MLNRTMVKLSVLDLAYIGEGFTPTDALTNALDLAQHAEGAGYTRFWLAEHHNFRSDWLTLPNSVTFRPFYPCGITGS